MGDQTVTLEELQTSLKADIDAGEAFRERIEHGDALSTEERKEFREIASRVKTKREELAEREGDHELLKQLKDAAEAEEQGRKARLAAARTPKYEDDPNKNREIIERKTLGEMFVESDPYKDWLRKYPQGGPTTRATVQSDAIMVPDARKLIGLQTPTEKARKGLVTAADASAGTLVRADWLGLLEPGLVRPLTIRDLVTVMPTTSDTIEYAAELSRTYGAAPVAEASALTGSTGLKPSSDVTFEDRDAIVRTIAVWIAVTKRIMSDAPLLGNYIDEFLRVDLALELEDQMLSGDGTGQNFTGILNDPLVNTTAAGTGPFYAIRSAITELWLTARTRPTAIAAHPTNVEEWDLSVINSETNHFVGGSPFSRTAGVPRVWGLPVVETDAVPEGTAIVANWRFAILFDREQTAISTGTVDDDFIRNIVRVLAELRAAFGIIRPKAFNLVSV